MNELATQAANDTNTTADRTAVQQEINQLASEITRIASTTQFNTMNLIDGNFTGKKLQVGSLCGQAITIDISDMSATGLGVSGLVVSSFSAAGKAMSAAQDAISYVSSMRSSWVHYRTDLSTQSPTWTTFLRTHLLQSLVSVIQIWLLRWLNTARIIFFHRLDSQCFHRLISRHREFFHSYSNIIKKSGARTAVMSQLWLFFNI